MMMPGQHTIQNDPFGGGYLSLLRGSIVLQRDACAVHQVGLSNVLQVKGMKGRMQKLGVQCGT
jgi:hypothetical protein